jgi:hypothetical protein
VTGAHLVFSVVRNVIIASQQLLKKPQSNALCERETLIKKYLTFLGHAVAQLVEALRYKPVGSGFNSR